MLEPMVGYDEKNSLLFHSFRGYSAIEGILTLDISRESVISGTTWYNVSVILRLLLLNGPMTSGELLRCHYDTFRQAGIKFSKDMDDLNDSYEKSFKNQLKRSRDEYKVVKALDVKLFREITGETWEEYQDRIDRYGQKVSYPVFPLSRERYEKLLSHKNHIIYIPRKDEQVRAYIQKMLDAFDSIIDSFRGGSTYGE